MPEPLAPPGTHQHGTAMPASQWALFEAAAVLVLITAALAYAVGLWASRSRPWPIRRTVLWYLGLSCVAAALLGPLAAAARTGFTAHMVGHLLLGMIALLLMVWSAPVTLALRALPVAQARSVTQLLRSPPARLATHPIVAAALNAGGVWVLYTTSLFHLMHAGALLHALVHAHIFLAGYLLTASLIGIDPDPHRASMPLRSAVLIMFIAAHSILATRLYAHPPTGIEAGDARLGAQVMYYGGDAVDVVIIVALFAGWYRATRPRRPTLSGADIATPGTGSLPAALPRGPSPGRPS